MIGIVGQHDQTIDNESIDDPLDALAGRTEQADAYEGLENQTVAPGITAMGVDGHRSTEVLRRIDSDGHKVEFLAEH